MSIINQLCRQKTGMSMPCDLEKVLVDYIKTFNGNDKVFKLLNIIDCKFKDQFCDDLYGMTVKQLNVVRKEMRIRPCNIVGTGVKDSVLRCDLIDGLMGIYLDKKYEKNFEEFSGDSIFNQDKYRYGNTRQFYTCKQMRERMEEFKKKFITEQTENHICMIRMIQEESGVRSNNAELYINELKVKDYREHDSIINDERRKYMSYRHKIPQGWAEMDKIKIYLPELYASLGQRYLLNVNVRLKDWRISKTGMCIYTGHLWCF
tara:strand:+ start:244 stop:1026 length:783 start_codon:yes stop_codon:yes gene_type:complete